MFRNLFNRNKNCNDYNLKLTIKNLESEIKKLKLELEEKEKLEAENSLLKQINDETYDVLNSLYLDCTEIISSCNEQLEKIDGVIKAYDELF